MNLSILIASLEERAEQLDALVSNLERQANGLPVEIMTMVDNRGPSIGKKRQELLKRAKGLFIVFCDDDDEVSNEYVKAINNVITSNPEIDCIGIQGWMITNGESRKEWKISKEYKRWYEAGGIYFRTPNHISPVRRGIALKVGFEDMRFGEDYKYSMGILPYLKDEIKIEQDLYHYKFSTLKPKK